MSISIDFGAIRSWNMPCSLKLPKNPLEPILAFKVIQITEFGANREPVYDFLLVINSNLGPISQRYLRVT